MLDMKHAKPTWGNFKTLLKEPTKQTWTNEKTQHVLGERRLKSVVGLGRQKEQVWEGMNEDSGHAETGPLREATYVSERLVWKTMERSAWKLWICKSSTYASEQQRVYGEKKGTEDRSLDIPTFIVSLGVETCCRRLYGWWQGTKAMSVDTLEAKDNQVNQGGNFFLYVPSP